MTDTQTDHTDGEAPAPLDAAGVAELGMAPELLITMGAASPRTEPGRT